jgi:hypothetical protein
MEQEETNEITPEDTECLKQHYHSKTHYDEINDYVVFTGVPVKSVPINTYQDLLDCYGITIDEIRTYLERVKKYENSNNGTQAEQIGERLSVDREADGVDKSGNK